MKRRTLKTLTLLVGAALSLARVSHAGMLEDIGAGAYKAIGSPGYTTVIPPGTRLVVGGEATVISGSDLCPSEPVPPSKYLWFMGGHPVDGSGCVVFGPATKSVPVSLYGSGGKKTSETWSVEHLEHKGIPMMRLKRPNGDFVGAEN
ncbi:hypothetical protein ACUXQ2_005665 [Cupriavidus metallidurans]|uniref:Uncharacterized protein n=1 Tax=Cupriavidus metallidurans (strain ATCC 43123 / DSM 2839 / NBRC 102507 / CH34) TaxID=266264 RepID=D3DYI3_CUPMC|nr:hypothetical protein [Cupriavidus metallidurans]ADC45353.1 hypothetical protein Rmet_6358 [Cupriavidus metallidurans CH34]